jgi:glutamine synthetase
MYPDPFRLGDNILVMCETYMSDGSPNKYNFRHDAAMIMEKHEEHGFWFGLEQEYTLLDAQGWPYGWPKNGFPAPQGPYYCGVGTGKVFCRDIVEAHYKACMYADINISGTNAEVMPAQWEYQVGPCPGIECTCPPDSTRLTHANYLMQWAISSGCPGSCFTALLRSSALR